MMRTLRTRRLLAVKPHKYGTRHLTAGDEYEAPLREAVALVVSKKAKFAAVGSRPPSSPPPAPPVRALEPAASDVEQLRAQAAGLGVEVDRRWGVARLQYEINKATAG